MKLRKLTTWIAIPLMAVSWLYSANAFALIVTGVTVEAPGSIVGAGITNADGSKIKYFIPLRDDTGGVYGVTPNAITSCGIAGECRDYGDGSGYDAANALMMNIYFELPGQPQAGSARLDFIFDDLDLTDNNDPLNFFESILFSYWDGSMLSSIGGTVKDFADLGITNFPGGTHTDDGDGEPISWSLYLTALSILGHLNNTLENNLGFWIQLGFGSDYDQKGKNTPEYLSASLTVSPVPLPAAVWLFGSSLIGFIGMSRRTRV